MAKEITPGLRERKSAATRLAIAGSLQRRLGATPLAEILVEDLAADANVSRVTFFNYFPTKEHAVDLVLVMFMFEINARLSRKKLRGVDAIVEIFERTGERVAEAPAAHLRMMGYLATRPADRPLPELGRVERATLAPDQPDVELRTLGAMFIEAIDEARRDGELDVEGTSYELANYLGALSQGVALLGHSSPDTDYRRLYARHVRRALGLGFSGVAAPTTPEKWRKKRRGT